MWLTEIVFISPIISIISLTLISFCYIMCLTNCMNSKKQRITENLRRIAEFNKLLDKQEKNFLQDDYKNARNKTKVTIKR